MTSLRKAQGRDRKLQRRKHGMQRTGDSAKLLLALSQRRAAQAQTVSARGLPHNTRGQPVCCPPRPLRRLSPQRLVCPACGKAYSP